jgi:hypothetical protein
MIIEPKISSKLKKSLKDKKKKEIRKPFNFQDLSLKELIEDAKQAGIIFRFIFR